MMKVQITMVLLVDLAVAAATIDIHRLSAVLVPQDKDMLVVDFQEVPPQEQVVVDLVVLEVLAVEVVLVQEE